MRRRLIVPLFLALVAGGLTTLPASGTAAPTLRVGVGRADITSPAGYYMQGWVRSDAVLRGVHTRIEARAIVLERGGRKLALVAEDLNGIAGGVVKAAAIRLKALGFDESNIIVSASHTHASPSGYYPYTTYNTVFMTTGTLTTQNASGALDPQLYAFEVRQLVAAITKADQVLAPGKVGWSTTQLLGLTANRSLEAHLNDFGVIKAPGDGQVSDDPYGYANTIDPDVQVLRVDKRIGATYKPVGMWSSFADHGTVNKFQFGYYNADHHGAATRVVEQQLRSEGAVPATQDVVNAYGNTDEGDQSAGLTRSGPAAADFVGQAEAAAMLTAWRAAGKNLTNTPTLATRFVRACFCGAGTSGGPVAGMAASGLPLFTGSEEGRGPLYDITHTSFEGRSNPARDADAAQGHKLVVTRDVGGSTPTTVPLTVAQIGDRLVATIPGEMTVEMGRRVRSVLARAGAAYGIKGVQLSGLANEYLSYFTTPEEYDAQHYEGGSTMYGRETSVFVQDQLLTLTRALMTDQPAPTSDPTDPRRGVVDTAAAYGTGATEATATMQPVATERMSRARFGWTGGVKGLDMPLGSAFVSVQTAAGRPVTDDLGRQLLWAVDTNGGYTAQWQIPEGQAVGRYRFVITANHYRLVSSAFVVTRATTLSVQGNQVLNPDLVVNTDLTYRPTLAAGGRIARSSGSTVPAGGAVDAYGNCNGAPASTDGTRSGADPAADPAICRT